MPTTFVFPILPQTTGADIPLILNADDFGLTRGINRAIAELHAAGALTSATLMATGPAFDDAVAVAHGLPSLGVGCHVVLVDGIPASDPATIPTLVGADGKSFRSSLAQFSLAAARGNISPDDITREATAQISRLQEAGIAVTHLDTHKHTHIFPGVALSLLDAAERAGIRAIRNPFEPVWSQRLGHAPPARRLQLRLLSSLRTRFLALPQIRSGAIRTTNGTPGIAATGTLDAPTLKTILAAVPEGTWELVCHPGYSDADLNHVRTRLRSSRDIERLALLDVLGQSSGLDRLHYGNLWDPA